MREDLKEHLVDLIENHCYYIDLAANDTFFMGADCTSVDVAELPVLLSVYKQFGRMGVLAFQTKIRPGNQIPLELDEAGEEDKESYENAMKFLDGYQSLDDCESYKQWENWLYKRGLLPGRNCD